MEHSSCPSLVTQDGFQGTIAAGSLPLGEEGMAVVRFDNGERIPIPVGILRAALAQEREDGRHVLPMTLAEARDPSLALAGEARVIPVVEEKLSVRKRMVETGRLRLIKKVSIHPEEVDDPVWQEAMQIERVAVNRPLDGPVPVRYEGDTLIVPVLEEKLVVEKRLFLKEELRITKRRVESRQPRRVILRSEKVTVERVSVGERDVEIESR